MGRHIIIPLLPSGALAIRTRSDSHARPRARTHQSRGRHPRTRRRRPRHLPRVGQNGVRHRLFSRQGRTAAHRDSHRHDRPQWARQSLPTNLLQAQDKAQGRASRAARLVPHKGHGHRRSARRVWPAAPLSPCRSTRCSHVDRRSHSRLSTSARSQTIGRARSEWCAGPR